MFKQKNVGNEQNIMHLDVLGPWSRLKKKKERSLPFQLLMPFPYSIHSPSRGPQTPAQRSCSQERTHGSEYKARARCTRKRGWTKCTPLVGAGRKSRAQTCHGCRTEAHTVTFSSPGSNSHSTHTQVSDRIGFNWRCFYFLETYNECPRMMNKSKISKPHQEKTK